MQKAKVYVYVLVSYALRELLWIFFRKVAYTKCDVPVAVPVGTNDVLSLKQIVK
jgi:hypothetical protein